MTEIKTIESMPNILAVRIVTNKGSKLLYKFHSISEHDEFIRDVGTAQPMEVNDLLEEYKGYLSNEQETE